MARLLLCQNYDKVDLCEDCMEALVLGEFAILASRNRTERTIKVKT